MNLELLQRPFSTDQVKKRTTSLGNSVDYVETHSVITRLNEVFNGEWSFKIIEHKLLEDDVVVLGELTADGVTKQQFGTCELNQESEEGIVFSIGDALKAAASDALKKAATLFGIGLQLYRTGGFSEQAVKEEDTSLNTQSKPSKPDREPSPTSSPLETSVEPEPELITDLQFAEIVELAKQRNVTQAQVDRRARSRYGRGLAELTQSEAHDIILKLRGN